MLSGIGPTSQLKKYKIRQVTNLPVGKNLQDHCSVLQALRIHNPDGSMTMDITTYLNPMNFLEFYSNGTGQLVNAWGVVGVMNTPKNKGKKRPGNENIFLVQASWSSRLPLTFQIFNSRCFQWTWVLIWVPILGTSPIGTTPCGHMFMENIPSQKA